MRIACATPTRVIAYVRCVLFGAGACVALSGNLALVGKLVSLHGYGQDTDIVCDELADADTDGNRYA